MLQNVDMGYKGCENWITSVWCLIKFELCKLMFPKARKFLPLFHCLTCSLVPITESHPHWYSVLHHKAFILNYFSFSYIFLINYLTVLYCTLFYMSVTLFIACNTFWYANNNKDQYIWRFVRDVIRRRLATFEAFIFYFASEGMTTAVFITQYSLF